MGMLDNAARESARTWAVVVGHPGHELRLLGWMRQVRPAVAVLTDGSGSGERGRLPQTIELLDKIGAATGPVFGVLGDREVYAAMCAGDAAPFLAIAHRLADWFVETGVDCVASDAPEGYNPTHDLCAAITAVAVRLANQRRADPVRHYTYPVILPPVPRPASVHVSLDDAALDEKLDFARAYAASAGGALIEETEQMIAHFGREAFRDEVISPADTQGAFAAFATTAPFYEAYGRKKVAEGLYDTAICFAPHFAPLLRAMEA